MISSISITRLCLGASNQTQGFTIKQHKEAFSISLEFAIVRARLIYVSTVSKNELLVFAILL